nr:MAG TPA: hypothetical protein [Caudoviricetes sp.]
MHIRALLFIYYSATAIACKNILGEIKSKVKRRRT